MAMEFHGFLNSLSINAERHLLHAVRSASSAFIKLHLHDIVIFIFFSFRRFSVSHFPAQMESNRWQSIDFLFILDSISLQRATDPDVMELYNKKVRIVNRESGDMTYQYFRPSEGMAKVKMGGKLMPTKEFFFFVFSIFSFGARDDTIPDGTYIV